MNNKALKQEKQVVTRYNEMINYLSVDNGYWFKDVWNIHDEVFKSNGHKIPEQTIKSIRFEKFENSKIENEIKYYLAYSLKTQRLSAITVFKNYRFPLEFMREYMNRAGVPDNLSGMQVDMGQIEMILRNRGITTGGAKGDCYRYYNILYGDLWTLSRMHTMNAPC